ncbi:MAG: ATP-binding protein [Burkholderiaceae bacterium]
MSLPRPATAAELENCAIEPIHIPGAIQPHGCLLAFDPATLRLRHASVNVAEFLGTGCEAMLGRPIHEVLPGSAADSVRRALAEDAALDWALVHCEAAGQRLEGVVHAHEEMVFVELERVGATAASAAGVEHAIRHLAITDDLAQLSSATARVIREITGFDRVVVYRFDRDDNGEVVAEARDDALDPFLGLHFPESDIPRQARALYCKNWIRTIPDAGYTAVPIVPALRQDTHAPLDLGRTFLRSVSPVHLEYLANMGVQGSMSVSLVVGGRLWGLISCGHRTPRRVPARLRSACESIGRIVSLQIAALETLEISRVRGSAFDSMQALKHAMRDTHDGVLAALSRHPVAILQVAQAQGVAIVLPGEPPRCIGRTPPPGRVAALAQWLGSRFGPSGIFETRELGATDSQWSDIATVASGVLAFALPTPQQPCVLWFRPEVAQTVSWGGDPAKGAQVDPNGMLRVHPRRSFELWKQVVRGRALDWSRGHVEEVLDLRRLAIESDLVHQVRKEQEAVRARDDLVAVVSHDLRTPMSVVVMQAALLQHMADSNQNSRLRSSAQIIQRAGERMAALLRDLLDLAKIEAGRFEVVTSPQPVQTLLEEACGLLRPVADAAQVELSADPVTGLVVRADPERIYQVLANLIGNAIKFSNRGGKVSVGAHSLGTVCEVWVSDEGTGISAGALPHIFDRYWQARANQKSGAGLGLFICKGVVEAHGGSIRVQSREGTGSTFFFTLPLEKVHAVS